MNLEKVCIENVVGTVIVIDLATGPSREVLKQPLAPKPPATHIEMLNNIGSVWGLGR
jgi:hypothetical protein